jgi:hypothetical protein
MKISLMGIAIHIGLSMVVALPARAQSNQPVPIDVATLERPVAFEISPSTGTLKETAQRGQEDDGGATTRGLPRTTSTAADLGDAARYRMCCNKPEAWSAEWAA